jgi:hypothetical protein
MKYSGELVMKLLGGCWVLMTKGANGRTTSEENVSSVFEKRGRNLRCWPSNRILDNGVMEQGLPSYTFEHSAHHYANSYPAHLLYDLFFLPKH